MAIEQQMNMLARGGLDDDGMSRDPVSGNTIPAGSMANEVRDDVDAKLSDGEYVVPANVVRFFGVKFFEDLRTQAMQGLGTMEANGRIGGEPMPSDMPMQDQMAGSPEELSEQDMAMLQNIMNEGGDVRGYAHGGYHDPVNDPQPIPQSIPSSVYPLTQYATPGASTVLSNLNPNLPPSAITATPDDLPLETNNPEFRFVTMVNPVNGNIQVVQFKGDVPVDANAYNQLINSGFYVQGSPELAQYKQEANRDPEQDQSVQDGTKPANRQTVGELLWTTQRGIYGKAFPDSFTAKVSSKLGKVGTLGLLGAALPDGPTALEANIREAKERLARGKNYQGVAMNAAEKAGLQFLVGLEGLPENKIYDMIYKQYGIHLGIGKKSGKKRNIRVPDLTKEVMVDDLNATTVMRDRTTSLKKALKGAGEATKAEGVATLKEEKIKVKTALDKIKKIKDDADDNNRTIAEQGRIDAPSGSSQREEREEREDAARGRGTTPTNRGGTGTAGKGVIDKTKDSASAYSGRTGSNREFGMNKGGLLKKPKKKTKTKKY